MIEILPGKFKGLAEALTALRKVDEDAYKALKKDLQKQAHPYVRAIQSRIAEAESQLRAAGSTTGKPANVFSNTTKGWAGANVKFAVSSRKYPKAVLLFDSTGPKGRYGYDIFEKAGLRGSQSRQGAALSSMLNNRLQQIAPTRMAYPTVVRQLPMIRADMRFILEAYQDKISDALRN